MLSENLLLQLFVAGLVALCLPAGAGTQGNSGRAKPATAPPTSAPAGSAFDDVPFGGLPAGWKADATHPGSKLAQWSVQKDSKAASGDRVLAMKITGSDRGTFNLLWTDRIRFQNGAVEVKVRAGGGSIDQGGGPIWRVRDANNYYIARWNPLENNFRVYYVQDGKRVQLDNADVNVAADTWHSIRIEHQGNQIAAYLDGKKLLQATDSTFPEAGGVGVWTKADAASYFDDFKVQPK